MSRNLPADAINQLRIPIEMDIVRGQQSFLCQRCLLLRLVLLINAALGALGIDTTSRQIVFESRSVKLLLKDGFGFNLLELGLEVLETGSVGAAIGTTASIVHVETSILSLVAIDTPGERLACVGSCRSISLEQKTHQPPFPAPFFLAFLGSFPSKPDFAKYLGRCSSGAAVPSARPA